MKKVLGMLVLLLAMFLCETGLAVSWANEMPKRIALLFSSEEWEGYECVTGYAYDDPNEVSCESDGNTAFVVMKKGDHNVICVLDEPMGGNWSLTAVGSAAIFQGDERPQFAESDSTFNIWLDYDRGKIKESISFFKRGNDWYLDGYSIFSHSPHDPKFDSFSIHTDVQNEHKFYVSQKKNGVFIYRDVLFYSTDVFRIEDADINNFPKSPDEVIAQFAMIPFETTVQNK